MLVLLLDLNSKGQYAVRQKILRSIKKNEKELVAYESQMISGFMMCITAFIGYKHNSI